MSGQKPLTPRQKEFLRIMRDHACEGWGDVYTHWNTKPAQDGRNFSALEFRNFEAVGDSLIKRGLLVAVDGRLELLAPQENTTK